VDQPAWSTRTSIGRREDVDRSYQLWVDTPPKYDPSSEEGYPLILCLDAIWTFGTAVDAARILGLGRELPRAIVAGIAHDEPDMKSLVQDRARDFTVSQAVAPRETGVRLAADEVGGAEAFRQWLDASVLPELKSDYPISEVTFVGHSFSALFGLHVLFNAPETFDHYLLASPSVWWDDEVMFGLEAEHAANTKDLVAHVFMSKGGLETDHLSMQREFYDQLAGRNHPGLDMTWNLFEGETHSSVVSAAVNRGLRVLLGP